MTGSCLHCTQTDEESFYDNTISSCCPHVQQTLRYFREMLELTKEPLGCLARYSASISSSSEAASTAVAGLAGVMAALNISLTFCGVAPARPLHTCTPIKAKAMFWDHPWYSV